MTRIAVLQMCSGVDPDDNTDVIVDALQRAASGSAAMLFTPEMSIALDSNRKRASGSITTEDNSPYIERLRRACSETGVWLSLGSCAVLVDEQRWANRALVIDGSGRICARYDKMHMFDVDLASGESWRESKTYRPGQDVVTIDTPVGHLGLSICYDIRFPALYQELGRLSCDVIAIPAAFTVPTGQAHWHILQRARAIESSCYVVAAAQAGSHADGRRTYGHSLVIDPWGEVLLDMGDKLDIAFVDLDNARLAEVRAQLPSLANRRHIPQSSAQ